MKTKDYRKTRCWQSGPAPKELGDRAVHLWKLSLPDDNGACSTGILSEQELRKADGFYFQRDRNRFIGTRTFLRNLLSCYWGCDPKEINFSYNNHGKPYLANPEREDKQSLFFNISHSREMALFALSHYCELGIDVEYMRDTVKYLELAQRFFSTEEYQTLAQLTGVALHRGFYRCWTRKEATVKAIGRGLSIPLDTFSVNLDRDDQPKLLWAESTLIQGPCQVFPISIDENYCAALACLGEPEKINLWDAPGLDIKKGKTS